MQCEFPGLGLLLTNRANRLEFVFEPLLLEHYEREATALIKEVRLAGWLQGCGC